MVLRAGEVVSEADLRASNAVATSGLVPDRTLLLTLAADHGLERAMRRGERDRMERADLAFHERVSRAFARFATPEWQRAHPECGPIELIDADGTESEVFDRVVIALHAHWPETFPSLSTAE